MSAADSGSLLLYLIQGYSTRQPDAYGTAHQNLTGCPAAYARNGCRMCCLPMPSVAIPRCNPCKTGCIPTNKLQKCKKPYLNDVQRDIAEAGLAVTALTQRPCCSGPLVEERAPQVVAESHECH